LNLSSAAEGLNLINFRQALVQSLYIIFMPIGEHLMSADLFCLQFFR
jgi:hypothetical protein